MERGGCVGAENFLPTSRRSSNDCEAIVPICGRVGTKVKSGSFAKVSESIFYVFFRYVHRCCCDSCLSVIISVQFA